MTNIKNFLILYFLLFPSLFAYEVCEIRSKDAICPNSESASKDNKPTVAFDVDYTIMFRSEKLYKRVDVLKQHHPDAFIMEYGQKDNKAEYYLCGTGYAEVIQQIIEWGWNVEFISAGTGKRNDFLIPQYLKTGLSFYQEFPENHYKNLCDQGQFVIRSREHLDSVEGRFIKKLSRWGTLDNRLIVDDKYDVIPLEEFPFIKVDPSPLKYCENVINRFKSEIKFLDFHLRTNAEYVMGILADCKKRMDIGEASSIRDALKQTLQISDEERTEKKLKHPWILAAAHFPLRTDAWIAEGSRLIAEMKKKRLPL